MAPKRLRCAGLGLILASCWLLLPGPGRAAAPPVGAGTQRAYETLAAAGAAARSLDPEAVQRRYDVAREIESALALIVPRSACRALYDALVQVAHGHVVAAEGFDRRSGALEARGNRSIRAGVSAYGPARGACPTGIRAEARRPVPPQVLVSPLPEEAFFGAVEARFPVGATDVEIRFRNRIVTRLPRASARVMRAAIPASFAPGRGLLSIRFRTGAGIVEEKASAWLLPSSAQQSVLGERPDTVLSARLETLAAGFGGYAAMSVHDLSNGRTAGWNDDTRFPGASTVKLGVLLATLARTHEPESSALLHDLRTLAGWSSNLSTNRLLRVLGDGDVVKGSSRIEGVMRRLGATRSTYPGAYRVGTSYRAIPTQPPLVSARTTTARDLSRILQHLHAAATGRIRSDLSTHAARVGLALLLDSHPAGDNIGLFRPALPDRLPAAQKHGWIASARHTAAIVYGPRGPIVVVLLTYQAGLTLASAQHLGRKVVVAALS